MPVPALNHVAITVRNIGISGPWYRDLLGSDPTVDEHTDSGFHHHVWIFNDGNAFGIHQHDSEAAHEEFSELRVGLDHVGFGCANRAELGRGPTASMSSASTTAASWTRPTARP